MSKVHTELRHAVSQYDKRTCSLYEVPSKFSMKYWAELKVFCSTS